MKKAIQHMILGLFGFAGIVLAAPNWFITHARPISNVWQLTDAGRTLDTLPAENTKNPPAPSILEGTARFACW
jgi:hypothetical protein